MANPPTSGVEVDSMLRRKRLNVAVFLEVALGFVLHVVVESKYHLSTVCYAWGIEPVELEHHSRCVVVCHHIRRRDGHCLPRTNPSDRAYRTEQSVIRALRRTSERTYERTSCINVRNRELAGLERRWTAGSGVGFTGWGWKRRVVHHLSLAPRAAAQSSQRGSGAGGHSSMSVQLTAAAPRQPPTGFGTATCQLSTCHTRKKPIR